MRRDAGLPQRLGHGRVQRGRREQGLAIAQARLDLGQVAVGQPLGQLAGQAQAVGMDAAGGQQHDGVAGAEPVADRQPLLGVDQAGAGGCQVDAAVFDDAGQRRRFAAAPGDLAGVAGRLPAGHQGLGALGVAKPVAAAGRPVGLHHQRRGADGDQVVDRHRDRVLRDAGEVALARQPGHLVGHQGLGAQAFDDGGDVERPHVHDIGRFAA
mmetsp:Transcript_30657/g.72031  ORF Transcript_30657/g.72031 Transcript_30657/m.72031 type:complete len:211 (-) Transcript_30657:932-1564(-)